MAAYCTYADLVERFGVTELAELTDEAAAAAPNQAEIAKHIDEASSYIDGYLSGKYQLPLSSTPLIVRKWACDIARKFIYGDRANDRVDANYDQALKDLGNVARGLMLIPDAEGTAPDSSPSSVAVVSSARVFSDRVLHAMPGGLGYGVGGRWRGLSRW